MPVIGGGTGTWTLKGESGDWPGLRYWPVSFECRKCGYKREFAKNETVYLDPECPHIDLAIR